MIKENLEEDWLDKLTPEGYRTPSEGSIVLENDKIHLIFLFPKIVNESDPLMKMKSWNSSKRKYLTLKDRQLVRKMKSNIKRTEYVGEITGEYNKMHKYDFHHFKRVKLDLLSNDFEERVLSNIVNHCGIPREDLHSIKIDSIYPKIADLRVQYYTESPHEVFGFDCLNDFINNKVHNVDKSREKLMNQDQYLVFEVYSPSKTCTTIKELIHDSIKEYNIPDCHNTRFVQSFIRDKEKSSVSLILEYDLGRLV